MGLYKRSNRFQIKDLGSAKERVRQDDLTAREFILEQVLIESSAI